MPEKTPLGERAAPSQWAFVARFRRGALGWRASATAIKRLDEALSEISAVARRDPLRAAEGAIVLVSRISPAFEHIDTSSGSLGAAVNRAIAKLAAIIAAAPATDAQRAAWLERLWTAFLDDRIPFIEVLVDHWGDLCVTPAIASAWADRLLPGLISNFSAPRATRGFFVGTSACLAALLKAGRHEELLDVVDRAPYAWWEYRRWGFAALVAQGRRAEALRYAEASRDPMRNDDVPIAQACESVLLESGMVDEAYRRYAIAAGGYEPTYLARFRALAKRYPHKPPAELLADLVASTPDEHGKWFAAAKSAGLFDEAIALANAGHTDPKTLTRAARDFAEKQPAFAMEASLAALRWFGAGYGFDVDVIDVLQAYDHGLRAAQRLDCIDVFHARARATVANADEFIRKALRARLG